MSSRYRGRWGLAIVAVLASLAAVAVWLATQAGQAGAAGKAPIVIGDVCDCSGAQASATAGWAPGLDVWAKWINARGGIDGHLVQIIDKDSAGNATTTVSVGKQLLANKKIVDLVLGDGSPLVLKPAIDAAKLPVVGGLGVDALATTDQYVFPVSTSPTALASALAAVGAKGQSNKNAAVMYCAEVAVCKQSVPLFQKGVQAQGGKLVYQAAISAAAPDYTAVCLAAKSAKASYVWMGLANTTLARVATTCAQNGYKPQIVYPNFSTADLAVPALSGAKITFSNALFNGSAASQFRAAVAKYNPGLRKQPFYGQYTFQAWLSGQELARAIQLANVKGNGPITRAEVFKGLYKMHNETLGGTAPNLTFHKGKPAYLPCSFAGQIRGGKLVGLPGVVC